MSGTLVVNSRVKIPLDEFHFSYVRSSGPGGQNVNKVATKAVLRWDVANSPSLPDDVRERFLARHRRRVTVDGELVLSGQRYRDQLRNTDDCLERLRGLLLEVAAPPKPRRPTKPTKGSRERRLKQKRVTSGKKEMRKHPREE